MHTPIPRFLCLLIVAMLPAFAHAQDAGVEFFEKKIRPALIEYCYECHSTRAKKMRGGLLLDSRAGWQKGGDSGPALVPKQPAKSLLLQALRYGDDGLKMPPKSKLPAAVIADFETWIAMGAPDPRSEVVATKPGGTWDEIVRQRQAWWSFQPVRNPPVPAPKNASWANGDIDRFILAKLEDKGLTPAALADPHTLIRRLAIVLTGLPPSADEARDFVEAYGVEPQAAVEALVDRLLRSPHFGERWARHWMDVVRFSETHGNEWNYEVHHAWRYRDYLIRAFNDDVPYDRLVREHIAGDLLEPRWNAKERLNESLLGTAFYRFGEVNHDDCISLRQIGYDLADNQIDTLTKAFQATTVACARCHDHKLDAVSMRDYYGLLGILRSARAVSHTLDHPDVNADILRAMRRQKDAIRRELADIWLRDVNDPTRLAKLLQSLPAKLPADSPWTLWTRLQSAQGADKLAFADAWKKVTDKLGAEIREATGERARFETVTDTHEWQVSGQGLHGRSANGEFVVAAEGDRALASLLPVGSYTHVLSDKLNGTLRSPVLQTARKHISFQVMGERRSAVRLVSNNCQLNYKNYRALTSSDLHWITFPIPDELDSLRVYAELMTMQDNPKFPDQLGQLGGDKQNDRVPWEKAIANPRSFFGVTRIVLHDSPAPPKADLSLLLPLLEEPAPTSMAQLAERLAARLKNAVQNWRDGRATEDDARWLGACVRDDVLTNRVDATPKLASLVAEYRKLDAALALPRVAPGLADCGPGFSQAMFVRGDCLRPGETTPRRFVEALTPKLSIAAGSGRRELAEALAGRDNPLTARVMVNRIWHHLFGAGLVRTVDDFGHVGDLPSHPELLDHLAQGFMSEGWSIKRLIRDIALSRTFQSAHAPSDLALERDPDNRLLQHYPARRMEAEAIRDAILATSGRLDRSLFGMSVPSYRDKDNEYRRLFKGPLDGNGRRSLYIKCTLMEAPKFLEAFDFPGGKVTQGRRDVTHVPAQALALLNDPFVLDQADVWSRRVILRAKDTLPERIAHLFHTALGRAPRAEETQRFAQFVHEVAELHGVARTEILTNRLIWRDVGHALFNLQEFTTIP